MASLSPSPAQRVRDAFAVYRIDGGIVGLKQAARVVRRAPRSRLARGSFGLDPLDA